MGLVTKPTVYTIIRPDGEERLVEMIGIPIKENGLVVRIIDVGRDVTEKKQIEKKIEENEKKFRMIFDSSPLVIVLISKTGIILDINKKIIEWLGYEKNELVGKNLFTLPIFNSKEKIKVVNNFKNRISEKNFNSYDISFIDKKGETKIGRITGSVFKDENGEVVGDLAMISDASQEIKARNALKISEERNRLITENTSDLISITDFSIKAKFIYLNSAYTKFLGYDKDKLIGTSGMDFIHPDDKKNLQPLLTKYLKEKTLKFFNTEPLEINEKIEYRIKDGENNWHLISSTVNIMDNDNILFVSKDITEEKKSEEKIKERNIELERINKVMVGRELKMIELKNRIKELEKKY